MNFVKLIKRMLIKVNDRDALIVILMDMYSTATDCGDRRFLRDFDESVRRIFPRVGAGGVVPPIEFDTVEPPVFPFDEKAPAEPARHENDNCRFMDVYEVGAEIRKELDRLYAPGLSLEEYRKQTTGQFCGNKSTFTLKSIDEDIAKFNRRNGLTGTESPPVQIDSAEKLQELFDCKLDPSFFKTPIPIPIPISIPISIPDDPEQPNDGSSVLKEGFDRRRNVMMPIDGFKTELEKRVLDVFTKHMGPDAQTRPARKDPPLSEQMLRAAYDALGHTRMSYRQWRKKKLETYEQEHTRRVLRIVKDEEE